MRDVVNRGERCASAHELINRIRALAGRPRLPRRRPQPPLRSGRSCSRLQPRRSESGPKKTSATATGVVPTLTESFAPEGAAEEASEAAPLDDTEFDIEFGADELGAAAPREAVRVEEHAPSQPAAEQATLDVAALQPELPPGCASRRRRSSSRRNNPHWRCRAASRRPRNARNSRASTPTCSTRCSTTPAKSASPARGSSSRSARSSSTSRELGRTVTRLKEQLRKLEIETEAQILHRHEDEHPGRAATSIRWSSTATRRSSSCRARSPSRSATSAASQGLLETLTREAQNLLLQQARVVTELQNGLMRTRMVPFQRHVQRLSRIVRQAATDTARRPSWSSTARPASWTARCWSACCRRSSTCCATRSCTASRRPKSASRAASRRAARSRVEPASRRRRSGHRALERRRRAA